MSRAEETIPVRPGEEMDWEKTAHYLRAHLPEIPPGELDVRQFPSGASNLTYLLRIGAWEGVLRRQPLGPIAAKAHDMGREAGLLARIHPIFSLAPRPYLYCPDVDVVGVPFYVMERRRGVVLDAQFPVGIASTPELCHRISESVVSTLAQIHALDWQAAGLGEFGHYDGFLERQVHGWIERFAHSRTDESPDVSELTAWLEGHIPAPVPPALIHNDFKLNNLLLDTADLARPVAVLDWEMATIGDPLFDLAISLGYWVQPDDPAELRAILPTVTPSPGFYSRAEFLQRYAELSGRDLTSMQFYQTLAYFKLAGILQQIYVRWKRGQTSDPRFAVFGGFIRVLCRQAFHIAREG